MEYGQPDDNNAIQEFLQWEHSARRSEGLDASSTKDRRYFIPHSEVAGYLGSERRLDGLLDALYSAQDPVERPSSQRIKKHYLLTFSILLCIGHGHFIGYFEKHESLQDQKLPLLVRPPQFPISTGSDLFDAFKQKQWKFCVPSFTYDMHNVFDNECILPIVKQEKVAAGGSAVISRIELLEEYNQLEPSADTHEEPGLRRNTFVLKSYRTRNAKKYYTTEKKAFMKLRNGAEPPQNIVSYYGSFMQNDRYNALLEYMDGGTLEQYMEDVSPPIRHSDIFSFWEHLLGTLRGLTYIHGLREGHELDTSHHFLGWHQDITPQNILAKGHTGRSFYESTFKLADLGLSHFKSTVSPKATDLDSYGTRVYGAPETFRFDDSMLQAHLDVGNRVDVWSLGCVFSEVVTWLVRGWEGLQVYRDRRRRDFQENLGLGAGDAFHNGSHVLTSVVKHHNDLVSSLSEEDVLTRGVMDLINDMMVGSNERSSSMYAYQKAMRILQKSKEKFLEGQNRQISFQPPSASMILMDEIFLSDQVHEQSLGRIEGRLAQSKSHHLSHNLKPSSRQLQVSNRPLSSPKPKAPNLSVDEGLEWKSKRKTGPKTSIPNAELLTELENRDHVFLIDNSESMKEHLPSMRKVIEILAYMLKQCDPDGIDFFFTSTPTKVTRTMKTKNIVRRLESTVTVGRCNMEDRLASILEGYLVRFDHNRPLRRLLGRAPTAKVPQRLNLYVLTDGVWQPKNDPSRAIIPLVKKLKQEGLRWNHVGIQFIRFGDDAEGTKHLERLDRFVSQSNINIVDTTPATGNVWKMILGAINHWFDDDDDSDRENTRSGDHGSEPSTNSAATVVA